MTISLSLTQHLRGRRFCTGVPAHFQPRGPFMRLIPTCMLALTIVTGVAAIGATDDFVRDFRMYTPDLSATGANPYFILKPGYRLYFKSDEGDLTITVLNDTRVVDGVKTRVVEERETAKGKLIEVSRNYFAISKTNGDVYYFGEEVDMYKNGKITGHEGAWLAGKRNAKAGIGLPGRPKIGYRYYQEVAPGVAMDRGEIVSLSETVKVPAGTFTKVLKIEETTPLEPGVKEYKYYAKGVGLIKDGGMELVSHGFIK